ncbi:hypothetical protein L7F22_057844 [Adiantum nelumboides]|nr:hypothetical protein [Adiantum nelumboides]
MEGDFQKLCDFEDDLENAFEWLEDHKGERRKSCSSRKKVCFLQKACERLRDAYEDDFKMESSDDDECVYMLPLSHEMGIPKMEEKEVQKEIGKKSLEEPLDTPIIIVECTHEVEVEHPLIKFMRVMSFAYGKGNLVCEEKHIIHNNVVCHDIQSQFEVGDVEMNEEEDVIKLFLDKTITWDAVDDKEDHNFDFEHVEEHIGMSKAEYEEGEHSITKNVLKQINLWSKLDKNEFANVLTHGAKQEDSQMQAFEENKTAFTGFEDQILMQSAEFSCLSSMDEFVDIDVGQVLVDFNINFLEDVYFRVNAVVEVDLYRGECQNGGVGLSKFRFLCVADFGLANFWKRNTLQRAK